MIDHWTPSKNTPAYRVKLCGGNVMLYFSYDTLIAARVGDWRRRLPNLWGSTTGRHFGALAVEGWDVYDVQEARCTSGDLPDAFVDETDSRMCAFIAHAYGATDPRDRRHPR